MSDFTEYSEFYKRAWERSLSERTTELQKEIETLRAENARYREALEFIADGKIAASSIKYRYIDEAYQECAREALKGGE